MNDRSFSAPPSPDPLDQEREINLRDYFQVLYRRKWWVVATFAAVFAATVLMTLWKKPVYRATAVLEVQKKSTGALNLESLFSEGITGAIQEELSTEAEILKGRTVAGDAARLAGHRAVLDRSERLYEKLLQALWSRIRGLAASEKDEERLEPGSLVRQREPLQMEVTELVPLDRPLVFKVVFSDDSTFQILDEYERLVTEGRIGESCTSPYFSLCFTGAAPPAGTVYPLVLRPQDAAVRALQSSLEVNPVRNTRLIRLELTAAQPADARRLLDAVISAYQELKIKQKTRMASRALEFIDQHQRAVEAGMQEAVGKLKHFKEENRLVNLSESVKVTVEELAELEKAGRKLAMQREQTKFLLSALRNEGTVNRESLYALGNAMDKPLLVSLATELSQLQAQRSALRTQFTDKHPTIRSLDSKISKLKRKIQAEVESLDASLQDQERALRGQIQETEKRLHGLPEVEQRLANLTRQARVYQDTYSFLLEKKGELQVTRAGQIGDVWVAEPAYAEPGFVQPRPMMNAMLAAVVGLFLGVGLAFFMEYLDDSVKNADDVQAVVQLPVLGTIGRQLAGQDGHSSGTRLPLATLDDSRSQMAEAFRTFRSNLLFTGVDQPRRLMLFASPLREEGKTTCAANLAVALSQMGKRVLLIDTDLRRPMAHQVFRCQRSPGLINALVAENWQKVLDEEAIQGTQVENLYLLPCGDVPPNPNEMLASEKMAQIIDSLAQRYDFVLFDSPPLLNVSDAMVLARRTDGVLLVARGSRTGRGSLQRAVDLLHQTRTEILGVVLNDIDFKRERYYYYQYYHYHYAYGDGGSEASTGKGLRRILSRKARRKPSVDEDRRQNRRNNSEKLNKREKPD